MSWDRPEISRSVRQSFNKNTHTHRKEETNPKMQVWDPEDDELPSFLWNNRWRPFFFGSLIDATMPNHPILEVLKIPYICNQPRMKTSAGGHLILSIPV